MAEDNTTPRTRVRAFDVRAGRIYRRVQSWNNIGTPLSDTITGGDYSFSGSQLTESVGHPFRSSSKKGYSDIGGNFFTTKRYFHTTHHREVKRDWKQPTTRHRFTYSGPIMAVTPGAGLWNPKGYPESSNEEELDALGATAVAQCKPTNPSVDLLSALGEMRKGQLPKLPAIQSNWRDRTLLAKNAGSEYLNVQFGWSPLIRDMSAFGGVVSRADAVISQYKRDIGRPIRRTFRFPTETETAEDVLPGTYRPYAGSAFQWWSPGQLIRKSVMTRDRWFSGCFTYYFPSEILGSRKLADLAILGEQLGLEPTPEVVWELTPWSWAADWFSNTGDVISNWTSFNQDGLVMRYGYMMEHTIITTTYSLVGAKDAYAFGLPVDDVSFVTETKVRRRANPYGFGVDWDGLNPFQLSILAALGVSRF